MWTGRAKWKTETEALHSGDVVWLIDKDAKPGNWKVGRILETFPGQDGRSRVVKLKIADKEMMRPVSQVFPLEFGRETQE